VLGCERLDGVAARVHSVQSRGSLALAEGAYRVEMRFANRAWLLESGPQPLRSSSAPACIGLCSTCGTMDAQSEEPFTNAALPEDSGSWGCLIWSPAVEALVIHQN
jgi:hypothetical protein